MTVLLRWLLAAAFVLAASTGWFAWRYVKVGKLFIQNQQEMSAQISTASRNDTDGSGIAVAQTLHRNEELFEHTLALGAAQRTAGLLALVCAAASLIAAAAAALERRRQT